MSAAIFATSFLTSGYYATQVMMNVCNFEKDALMQ